MLIVHNYVYIIIICVCINCEHDFLDEQPCVYGINCIHFLDHDIVNVVIDVKLGSLTRRVLRRT